MSKPWGDISDDERRSILEAIKKVYDDLGNPTWLKNPKSLDQYVNVLAQGELMKQCFLIIEGEAPLELKDSIDETIAKLKEAASGVADAKIDVKVKYGVGQKIGRLEKVNKVFEDEVITLEHKEGEVWMCDLWATWCPPCQRPMKHNHEMIEKRPDWKGKVRIMGLSIDDNKETVKAHVEKEGWTGPEHYHVRGEGCKVSSEYGSGGVPHIFIVDTKGTIVFMGHPAERENLEEDFDKLLRGEELTGKGTGKSATAEGEGSSGGSSAQDEAAISAAKSNFLKDTETLRSEEETKELAKKFQRAFLVLVDDAEFDVKTGNMKHDLVCVTQLIGGADQADFDKLHDKLKTINQNDLWKN